MADSDYSENSYTLFYKAFKDLKANHPEVKNIIIDESVNSGGDCTTLIELAGFLMSEVTVSLKNKVNNEVYKVTYQVDTNFDGVYDDNDYQAKGYYVYDLISTVSFSCGNFFPTILKQNQAATIIGQTSSGGSCIVAPNVSSQGDTYQLSGITEYGTILDDGSFYSSDNGIHPDIGIRNYDYFYDKDKLLSYIE